MDRSSRNHVRFHTRAVRPGQTGAMPVHASLFYGAINDGMPFCKGKLVQEAGIETYYFLISSKKAI